MALHTLAARARKKLVEERDAECNVLGFPKTTEEIEKNQKILGYKTGVHWAWEPGRGKENCECLWRDIEISLPLSTELAKASDGEGGVSAALS